MAELYALPEQGVSHGLMALLQRQEPEQDESAAEGAEQEMAEKAGELAGALIAMASVAKELETQAHLIHLNYECSNFLAIHTFLKGQYEAHLAQFDQLAEYVRSMDYLMPLCRFGLESAAGCAFKHVESREPKAMLMTYFQNLEAFAMAAKELERLAGECRAVDVQNYAAELVGDSFKASWFCKASLRGG